MRPSIFVPGIVAAVAVIAALGCNSAGTGPVEFDRAAFGDPPASARPWVRWWWPGNDVDDAELRREVEALAKAYFGGAEIQAFNAALDPNASPDEMARRLSVDTPGYFAHVKAALEAAREQGLQIDLSLGSGWPTGGMHVPVSQSLKTLMWGEKRVGGPGPVTMRFDGPDTPVFYELSDLAQALGEPLARYLPDEALLVAVVAARVTGGQRTDDMFDLTDQVKLDPASVRILTNDVNVDGELTWDVPDGTWQVIAFYSAPDGEFPNFNAQTEPGYVTDHFDADQVNLSLEHLVGMRAGLEEFQGSPLRGLFVDSMEFKAERFFTADFLDAFRTMRGYDVTPMLPAVVVPGADNSLFDGLGLPAMSPFRFDQDDERIQYDYQLTASDLFLDRFINTVRAWSGGHGMILRMQGYGANIDVLKASGGADIPETEQLYAGGSDVFLKIVSSGAHLYGRNLVGAEALVWPQRDHMTTPTVMKAAVDKLFAAGVNHVVYHGFPYRLSDGYGEAGWHPFSSPFSGSGTYSSNIAETNPFWPDFALLNIYVARCQVALRSGAPQTDVLVLYPWLGFPASFVRLEGHDEPLFQGRLEPDDDTVGVNSWLEIAKQVFPDSGPEKRVKWLEKAWDALQGMHALGWSWDWANEDALLGAVMDDDMIRVGGGTYRAMVLFETPWMTPGLASRLADMAKDGASIIVVGAPPDHQPGFFDHEAGDQAVKDAMARLSTGDRVRLDPEGSGDLAGLLKEVGVSPLLRVEPTAPALGHVTRKIGNGAWLCFFSNGAREPINVSVSFTDGCRAPQWFDPWTGGALIARTDDAGRVPLALDSFESRLLACGMPVAPDTPIETPDPVAMAILPITDWTIDVPREDGSGESITVTPDGLPDWRDVEELHWSGGPGTYRAGVELPALEDNQKVVLDLGRVEGVAEVSFNGRAAGRLIVPPFKVDVTSMAMKGPNKLEVVVTPPARNRLIGKALAKDPDYAQFAGKKDALAHAGMLGPVNVVIGAQEAE
ncbi:MAG: hypothetical protein GXP54_13710 [Deltaproteobacteria bacterium]|nr:hypothetical protein [Deltaproteobacteria bacterium]